jgi:uroporphyrin-III C-methyltransferase / precorrin-2 dehydrogenase / sirohydrochlorin ferrochelatase
MHSLPLFLRLSGRTVILLGEGEAAEAKWRLLERAGAILTDDESAEATIAVVALDGHEADAAAARLKARGLLVNVVDRPDLCDFTTPAIIERDPVLIAIGTGGASAGLAKALRQRLEALLPANLGSLAQGFAAARAALRARWPAGADRRRAIDAALAEGGPLDPFAGHGDGAVAYWLDTGSGAPAVGRLEIIRLTSADPDELTLRAARLLGQADALWHKGDVPDAILTRARADAERRIAAAAPPRPDSGLHLWLEMSA